MADETNSSIFDSFPIGMALLSVPNMFERLLAQRTGQPVQDIAPQWQPKVGQGMPSPNSAEEALRQMAQVPERRGQPQGKEQASLPKDPNALENRSRVLAPGQEDVTAALPEPAPGAAPTVTPASFGDAISPPTLPQPTRVPRAMVSDSDAIRTAMLQMGLNLMVPQWGGPLEQLGQAFGSGAEAVGRRQAAEDEAAAVDREAEAAGLKNRALSALVTQREEAAETSRAKRLKGETEKKGGSTAAERLAVQLGLGPKGRLILEAELKNRLDPLDEASLDDILTRAKAADGTAAAAAEKYKVGDKVQGSDGKVYEKYKLGGDGKEFFREVK